MRRAAVQSSPREVRAKHFTELTLSLCLACEATRADRRPGTAYNEPGRLYVKLPVSAKRAAEG